MRHTLSVLAAMALGVAMAAASGPSYAAPTGQYGDDPIRRCERAESACLSACNPGTASPEQLGRCQHACREADERCMAEIGFARARASIARLPQATAQARAQ